MDLSLKYRPKTFSEVIGQQYIVQSIQNAIKYNESAPLYLFGGAHGTGKTTLARLIAMALCCQDLTDYNPCGKCDSCKTIINGGYFADISEINAAQFTKKDDANSLIFDTINYQPLMSSKKIYILDECHQLSKAAQQSLLKIFEEPPKNVVFILCTTESNKVLPTIIDRSLYYDFRPIPTKDIFDRVKFICSSENIEIEEDAIWSIAKESNGSMRKPFKILATVGIHEKITIELLSNIIGTTNTQAAIEFLDFIFSKNRFEIVNFVDNIISKGKNIEGVILESMECLTDILRIKLCKEYCIINRSEISIERLRDIGKKVKKGDDIINVLNALDKGIKQLNNSYASNNVLSILIALDAIQAIS